jgi:hypothetical protein
MAQLMTPFYQTDSSERFRDIQEIGVSCVLGNQVPRQIHELSARVGVAPPEPAPRWPDIVVPQAAMSRRSVPRDSRHAVEIRISTGKIGKSMDTHRGNDQRIVMQKPSSLTGFSGEIRPRRVD